MEPYPEERGGINFLPCVLSFTGRVRFPFVYSCIRVLFVDGFPLLTQLGEGVRDYLFTPAHAGGLGVFRSCDLGRQRL